jgi:GcrA cell cycle regulator
MTESKNIRGPAWWNEERERELIDLVSKGHSFSHIAKLMGCGTRNMPLAKFHRLKLKDPTLVNPRAQDRRRPMSTTPTVRGTTIKMPPIVVANAKDIIPFELDGAAITLENRQRGMCEYPIGDPCLPDFRYCGHSQKEKSPYCEAHHKLCRAPNIIYRKKADHAGKQR